MAPVSRTFVVAHVGSAYRRRLSSRGASELFSYGSVASGTSDMPRETRGSFFGEHGPLQWQPWNPKDQSATPEDRPLPTRVRILAPCNPNSKGFQSTIPSPALSGSQGCVSLATWGQMWGPASCQTPTFTCRSTMSSKERPQQACI